MLNKIRFKLFKKPVKDIDALVVEYKFKRKVIFKSTLRRHFIWAEDGQYNNKIQREKQNDGSFNWVAKLMKQWCKTTKASVWKKYVYSEDFGAAIRVESKFYIWLQIKRYKFCLITTFKIKIKTLLGLLVESAWVLIHLMVKELNMRYESHTFVNWLHAGGNLLIFNFVCCRAT